MQDNRLDSWKEIAAYLRRDVTTVRRWEKREGLPVHRHLHERRESVYAYPVEIDAWSDSRRSNLLKTEAQQYPPRSVLAWTLTSIFFVSTIALGGLLSSRGRLIEPQEQTIERRFPIPPPEGVTFNHVSVSPDGRQLAFTAVSHREPTQKPRLWVRALDSLVARALPDTDEASLPFWSPNSDALGFFAAGSLWTIDLASGKPRTLAVAPQGRGGSWSRTGVIVFAATPAGGLMAVPATGGATTRATTVDSSELGHIWPDFLPDGSRFLYLAGVKGNPESGHRVFVASLDGSPRQQVLSASSNVAYADGRLIFQRDRKLLAQPFDLRTLAATGDAVALADDVFQHYGLEHRSEFSLSRNGTLTFRKRLSPATRLVWRDRAGRSTSFLSTPAEYYSPAISPNEARVVYTVFDPAPSARFGYGSGRVRGNLALFDRTTVVASELVPDPSSEWGAVWSPDGRSIVFSSQRTENRLGLFLKDMTRPQGAETPLPSAGRNAVAHSWSADGRFVLFSSFDEKTRMNLWLLPMFGDRTPIPLLTGASDDDQPRVSPDGRWFAYTSNESGSYEVWVATFPTPTQKWRVSSGGAGDPRWSRDSKELFYVSDERQLMAVSVHAGNSFSHDAPVALFDTVVASYWYEARNLYDVTRDGRFLFMSPVEDERTAPLTMILNWAARLKR